MFVLLSFVFFFASYVAWNTYTLEWLPDKQYDTEKECYVHRLLSGTSTDGTETNHLMITEVCLDEQPVWCTAMDAMWFVVHGEYIHKVRSWSRAIDILSFGSSPCFFPLKARNVAYVVTSSIAVCVLVHEGPSMLCI